MTRLILENNRQPLNKSNLPPAADRFDYSSVRLPAEAMAVPGML